MRRMAAERPPLSFSKRISLVGPIRHYFPGPGRQQTDCVGTHHGNLTPPRISPSCPHCLLPVSPGAVAGQEYHYWIADEGRTGSKPAAMRNSPPQAALWTDGYRSAPSLAVFDAVSRTGGLGASSSVALAPFPEGLSSADVSRCRIFTFQYTRKAEKLASHCYRQREANF